MKNNKLVMILLVLVIVAGLGVLGYRTLGTVDLAEGYLYEEENLLLFAKVTNAEEISVEVTEIKVESEQGIPALKSKQEVYKGSVAEEKLVLAQEGGKTWSATVTKDEMVFLDPLSPAVPVGAKWVASTIATFEEKQKALDVRVKQEAERKKKEEAQVQMAKNIEKFTRLKADLLENNNYLNESQFSEETSLSQSHMAQLHGLLEEIKTYAAEPSLHRTEYEVMVTTVDSMKVLSDGIGILGENIARKKQSMGDLIGILESDVNELEKLWEEVKGEIPEAEKQKTEFESVKTATTEALDQAKERIAASDKDLSANQQEAQALYGQAQGLVKQTKEKFQF
jgi:hypothetical protein